jgi:hypothetical protein
MPETDSRRKVGSRTVAAGVLTYEERLRADFDWACREGDAHFSERSAAHTTLRRLAARLDALGTPYAVIGAMAMYAHGYQRFTTDVDVVVSRESLRRVHDALDGRGFVPPFPGSKNLRDTETGVAVDLVVAGDFPGDGRPQPVTFPDPATGTVEVGGVRYVTLETLVELKLASGQTSPHRLRDLADVQALLAELSLPRELAARLHPSVRAKYDELWLLAQDDPRRDEF